MNEHVAQPGADDASDQGEARSERIYRALPSSEWAVAEHSGAISTVDLRTDGFIHCSTAAQLPATVERTAPDRSTLVVAEIDIAQLAADVRWEQADDRPDDGPFPHVYGAIPTAAVTRTVPWDEWPETEDDRAANSEGAG